MVWWIQPQQLKDSLKWRMTAKSDEDGGGPFGRVECAHDTAEQAESCEACDEYVSGFSGSLTKKRTAELKREMDVAELARLKALYPGVSS